jgi:hypothetical protein
MGIAGRRERFGDLVVRDEKHGFPGRAVRLRHDVCLASDDRAQIRAGKRGHRAVQAQLAGGAFVARPFEPKDDPDADLDRRERRFSAAYDGFDVHCAVRIAADDDAGRERLVRYCTRPPFALDRIELLRDGRVSYLLKAPRKGRTHRVMAPMELIGRLAALIAPPKIPLVRYHGVFAPRSSWRPLVTPKPPKPAHGCLSKATAAVLSTSAPAPAPVSPAPASLTSPAAASLTPASPTPASPAPAPCAVWAPGSESSALLLPLALPIVPASTPMTVEHAPVLHAEPTRITVAHWGRLDDGELFAKTRYIDWAVLMKRTFGLDVLRCPRCGGRMRVLGTITQPETIRRILLCLGLRAEPLARAPARDPTWE